MKVIIDGDVLLYQAAGAKTATTMAICIASYWRIRSQIIGNTFADEVVVCFSTDGENFRKNEYPTYKFQRKVKSKPTHLSALKEWATANDPDAVGSPNGEADDYMFVIAAECIAADEVHVVASVDKDLKTMPCIYYNMREHTIQNITEGWAMSFMMQQFLTGDAVDGIKGLRGLGPKKAHAIIIGKTYEEAWDAIKGTWESRHESKEESWQEAFNRDINLVFIRRYQEHIVTLDFAGMHWDDLRQTLGFHLQDNEIIDI